MARTFKRTGAHHADSQTIRPLQPSFVKRHQVHELIC